MSIYKSDFFRDFPKKISKKKAFFYKKRIAKALKKIPVCVIIKSRQKFLVILHKKRKKFRKRGR